MEVRGMAERSLFEIHKRISNKELILPNYQRGDVWPLFKKAKWWNTIKKGGPTGTVITTYRLKDKAGDYDSPAFTNDGAQRVHWNVPLFRAECDTNDSFDKYLMRSSVLEMSLIYDSRSEAIDHFFELNALGTTCTPHELGRGIFSAQLPDFEVVWDPILAKIHGAVKTCLDRMGCADESKVKRDALHKRLRDNLSLFYRFLSKDKARNRNFKVATAHINDKSDMVLEHALAELLLESGPSAVSEALVVFSKTIDGYTALYQSIWNAVVQRPGTTTSNTHFRWWLQLALYLKNNNVSPNVLREFTECFLRYSGGRTSIYYKDSEGIQKSCSNNLSNLSNLDTTCRGIGFDPARLLVPRRARTPDRLLVPGYTESHVKAFSTNGNGVTVPENSVENLSRGTRDMTDEELARFQEVCGDIDPG